MKSMNRTAVELSWDYFWKFMAAKILFCRLTHQSLVSIVDLSLLAVGIIMLQLFYRLLQKKLTSFKEENFHWNLNSVILLISAYY